MNLRFTFNFSRTLSCCGLAVFLAACQADFNNTGKVPLPGESSVEPAVVEAVPIRRARPAPSVPRREQPIEPLAPISDLWDRIRGGLKLQEHYQHPQVVAQLGNYTENQVYFDLIVERASPFLFAIVAELEQRGLPLELALLPFVESTFDPNAYSPDNAVGLWQFMQKTASSYGLQQDWWYDGRRDPKASTIAALDYLQELNQQFDGDWLLALAAYNAGDGNVRRALRRNKKSVTGSVFWDLALPRETRLHVPKILALASLIDQVDAFPVELSPIANHDPLTVIEVGAQMDLAQAAQLAEMDYRELRALNPGYLQWATHPEQPQHITLPHRQAELLRAGLESLPSDELLMTWDYYKILPGDTLGDIARKLNTRVDVLQRVNGLRGTKIIAGELLLIPRGEIENSDSLQPQFAATRNIPPSVPDSYLVRSGDNLWSIARRFNLKSIEIAQWNGIQLNAVLKPGQVLDLRNAGNDENLGSQATATQGETYLVRSGDNMARIAARMRINLDDLLRWNDMDGDELIHPGKIIQIRSPETRLN